MTSSMPILTIYAALLATALLAPYASLLPRAWVERLWTWGWPMLCGLLLVGALFLTVLRNGDLTLLCAFLLLPLAGLGIPALLGGIAAVLIFATATWWTDDPLLGPVASGFFALLALAAGLLPRCKALATSASAKSRLALHVLLCGLIGLLAGLLTAPFESFEPLQSAWHHWSAYISPVEAWRGGGVPYRDFPIQYGLGPTAVLRATCGNDCWRAMYWVAISANALYFATLAGSALILTMRLSRGLRWLALVALFCASFIWTGYPVHYSGPLMTPSVAGLRFLSLSALLFHILLAEEHQVRRDWIGHATWLAALLWSVETAIFATLVWWPYLAIRDAGEAVGSKERLVVLGRGVLRGTWALAVGVCALVVMLYLLTKGDLTVPDFVAYIQHPPGVRQVRPLGTIWIALSPIALALPLLSLRGLSIQVRPLYICLVGFLGAGIYYISRSHDNNILNLFPLLVLLLLAILRNLEGENGSPRFVGAFIRTMLTAMIAFVATFNWGPWREGAALSGPLMLGPKHMLSHLMPQHDDPIPLVPRDGVAGLEYLRAHGTGMVVLFDAQNALPRQPGLRTWTPVNNIANYSPLPGAMIVEYIQRGAAAYRRPGWILVGPGFSAWALAFRTAYDVREEKAFGRYRAYYLVPRQSPVAGQADQLAALALDQAKPKPRR